MTLSRYAVPVMVRNGGSTPYDGTALGGLCIPKELAQPGKKIVAVDQGNRSLAAAYEVLTDKHPSNQYVWILLAVTGRFEPGETLLHVALSDEARDPYFVPVLYDLISKTKIHVTHTIDAEQAQATLNFGSFGDFQTLVSNGSLLRVLHHGTLGPDLSWELEVEARRGEGGYRCDFRINNARPDPFADPHGDWIILDDVVIEAPNLWAQSGDNIDIRPGAIDLGVPTQLGPLAIVKGDKKGPLRMEIDSSAARAAVLIGGESAIPMNTYGNNRYSKAGRPGGQGDDQTDPRTRLGFALRGGQTVSFQFWVGAQLAKDHLDNPPVVTWANLQDYGPALIGAGSAKADVVLEPSRQRYERHRMGMVDESVVDSFPGHNPNTFLGFRDRGGTYPPQYERDNPHFGVRDFGDTVWSDGYNGGNHYHMGTFKYLAFLATGDMRFFEIAEDAAIHHRTIDFIASKGDGKNSNHPGYEKGRHHGNFEYCPPSHVWGRSMCLEYLLTGRQAPLQALHRLRGWLERHNTFDGNPVDPSWVASGGDPREWGAKAIFPGTSPDRGAGSGYQGDYGLRIPARAISIAVDMQHLLGWSMEEYVTHVIDQILRIEQGLWGGRGFILTRSFRSNGTFDHEQGWMHAYLTRAIGKAIQYGATKKPEHKALYDRMVQWMVNKLCAYGHTTPQGKVPMRPVAVFNENGQLIETRPGISKGTLAMWEAIRDGGYSEAAWDAWVVAFDAEMDAAIAKAPHLGSNPGLAKFRLAREAVQEGDADDRDSADWKYLVAHQWDFLGQYAYPSTNFAALFADTFAQAALAFGKQECAALALDMWQTSVWHLFDASAPTAYPNYQQDPSPVGYRMSKYPESEEKIHGVQHDISYMLELMEKYAPGVRAYYGVKDLQPVAPVAVDGAHVEGPFAASLEDPTDG